MTHKHLYALVSLLLVGFAIRGLITGNAELRGGYVVSRSENPFGYWLVMLLYGALIGVALFFAFRLP